MSRAAAPEATKAGLLEPAARDFDATYAEHFPFVWRCLRSLGVPESGLDDAAQDVFVIVHRKLPTFRGASSLRTWLYGIVRNVASNQRRTLGRRGQPGPIEPTLRSAEADPLEVAEDAEAAAFVREFADGLSDKNRDVFVLALLEQMTIPEVAESLSIPLNTAYTRLRAVRTAFKDALLQRGRR